MKRTVAWALVACGVVSYGAGCGSDDGKKRVNDDASAGAGGGDSGGDGGVSAMPIGGATGGVNDTAEGGDTQHGGGGAPASAGAAGEPNAAGGAGGAGGAPLPELEIGAYVSPTGSDTTGDGTLEAPFATLTPAAAVVTAGQAIGLLDGEHLVRYGVQIPEGVALVAVNPGAVTIGQQIGINGGITFEGNGAIDGLRLAWAVNFITVTAGTLTVTNTQFGEHGDGSGNDANFIVQSGGKLVLEAPSVSAPWYYEANGGRVAQVTDGGELEVQGGVFEGCDAGSVFFVYSGTASMSFTDVTFKDCAANRTIGLNNGGIGANNSTLLLDNVTLDNAGTAEGIYVGWGKPVVTIRSSTIDTQNATGIFIEGSTYPGADIQSVNLEDSLITGNALGIRAYLYAKAKLTLENTQVDGNTDGIRFQFVDPVGSSLDMSGGSIADNAGVGFDATSDTNKPNRIKLRGVSVTGNTGTGLALYGDASAAFDLGTAQDPGLNTFKYLGAAGTVAAITVNTASLVNAVGNTWLASEQGSSAAGAYVPSSGQFTEITGPVTTGKNYRIIGAGQKLRL